MAVEIIHDQDKGVACFFCMTTDTAFGPVFKGPVAGDDAAEFLDWLRVTDRIHTFVKIVGDGTDPRDYSASDLRVLASLWEREYEKETT